MVPIIPTRSSLCTRSGKSCTTQATNQRARSLLQESLERHRRVYGDEHEKTARALFALAPLAASKDLDAAGALLTQALEIRRRVLPENHPDIAMNLGALAEALQSKRDDLEAARELYRQALAVFRDPGERHHPRAVALMNDYAALLGTMNRYAEAETLQREAIAIGQQVLGPGTLTVANLTNNLAVTLTSLGRLADAERAFREAFEQHWRFSARITGACETSRATSAASWPCSNSMRRRCLGWIGRSQPAPAMTTRSEGMRAQRAWILFRLGRRAEALEQATAAVSALEHMKEEGRARFGDFTGAARTDAGRDGTTEGGRASSTRGARVVRTVGPSDPRYAEAECELGRAQVLQGMTAEGRATLERCLPIYRAWGQADREVVETLERTARGFVIPVSLAKPAETFLS